MKHSQNGIKWEFNAVASWKQQINYGAHPKCQRNNYLIEHINKKDLEN